MGAKQRLGSLHACKEGPLELPWGVQRAGGQLMRKGCGERYSEGVVLREARVPGLIITVAHIRPHQLEADLA